MTFEKILTAGEDTKLSVADSEFTIAGIERLKLASGDRMTWMWGSDAAWLVVDPDGDELIILAPVENEVELDEEGFALYMGNSYEEMYEDTGELLTCSGECEHEDGDTFEVKQFETDRGEILRRLTWTGYGEEVWFTGKMVTEEDVRET